MRYSLALFLVCCLGPGKWLNAKTPDDLEYGAVLFHYYQDDYFSSLVEYEKARVSGSAFTQSDLSRIMQGGMMLSYGLANESSDVFNNLLNDNLDESARNRAWFYLAKFQYHKGDTKAAIAALANVSGEVDASYQAEYHYLASLVNMDANQLSDAQYYISRTKVTQHLKPYLLFNLAIAQRKNGDVREATKNFKRVTDYKYYMHVDAYKNQRDELSVLADRARHSLALLAIEDNKLAKAWSYLKEIKTSGLYSNRGLLTYGWTAVRQQRYEEAIPALNMISERSIVLPEVQEAKVFLPHVYEQMGSDAKALQAYIDAEEDLNAGMQAIRKAKEVTAVGILPESFLGNLKIMTEDSDWLAAETSDNYATLTPFLLDLMASHSFRQSLAELHDLYEIRDNLKRWQDQVEHKTLVLHRRTNDGSDRKLADHLSRAQQAIADYSTRQQLLKERIADLRNREISRFEALGETTSKEIERLNDKIAQLQKISGPYLHPQKNLRRLQDLRTRVDNQLTRVSRMIDSIEPAIHQIVTTELDKHEERMKYYFAQAKLGKARLYDKSLTTLKTAQLNPGGPNQ